MQRLPVATAHQGLRVSVTRCWSATVLTPAGITCPWIRTSGLRASDLLTAGIRRLWFAAATVCSGFRTTPISTSIQTTIRSTWRPLLSLDRSIMACRRLLLLTIAVAPWLVRRLLVSLARLQVPLVALEFCRRRADLHSQVLRLLLPQTVRPRWRPGPTRK